MILEGTKASLKSLDMDYHWAVGFSSITKGMMGFVEVVSCDVNMIYCHSPDTFTPIEETVRAMNYVIDNERLDLVGPIVEQPEYNMLSRHKVESEYLPLYTTYGLGLTTWSPLASGVLTGKYNKGGVPSDSRFALENYKNLASRSLVDDVLKKVDGLKPIADELGVPLSQLAIAWCAANPNVSSVITGATKESQIQENMKAVEVIPLLTPAVMEKIEAVVQSKPKRPDSFR
ncbi:hypothetical protein NC652_004841 [Populus alba x Populus x berolinensis]|nr:hypothetical protein NC652_004841 [Populus alba x Populus x berolinensis]